MAVGGPAMRYYSILIEPNLLENNFIYGVPDADQSSNHVSWAQISLIWR
jgi:hypothetical protein